MPGSERPRTFLPNAVTSRIGGHMISGVVLGDDFVILACQLSGTSDERFQTTCPLIIPSGVATLQIYLWVPEGDSAVCTSTTWRSAASVALDWMSVTHDG